MTNLLLLLLIVVLLIINVNAKSSSSISSFKSSLKTSSNSMNKNIEEKTVKIVSAATSVSKKASTVTSDTKLDLKVISCILGGALAHLTLGTLFCWGNFMSYAPSFLSNFDGIERAGQPDKTLVIPFTLVSMCLTMPIGPIVVGKLGSQKTMFIGTLLVSLGVYLASYAKTLLTFILCYSGLFGAGVGISYAAPMIAGWKWLPNAKGLVSGVILTGFGAGGFIFSLLGTSFVNPNGLNPTNGKFPNAIYDAFPGMLQKLALLYFIVGSLGAALITKPAAPAAPVKGNVQAVTGPPGVGVLEAIKTPQFWILWTMVILSATAGLTVSATYKQFAVTTPILASDSYLALVGATGAIFNGLGRLFWGSVSDKIGFKNSFTLLAAIQAVLHVLFPYSTYSKTTFIVAFSMVYFLLAGNFALMPPAAQKIFGAKNGAIIYGILYTSFASASVAGILGMKPLIARLGWSSLFRTMAALSLGATVVTTLLKPLKSLPSSTV